VPGKHGYSLRRSRRGDGLDAPGPKRFRFAREFAGRDVQGKTALRGKRKAPCERVKGFGAELKGGGPFGPQGHTEGSGTRPLRARLTGPSHSVAVLGTFGLLLLFEGDVQGGAAPFLRGRSRDEVEGVNLGKC
jgi:hypothetical protein